MTSSWTASRSSTAAINFNQNTGVTVHNLAGGLIEGSRHGITGNRGVTVVNDAGGLIVGRNGSAINIDNDGSIEQAVHVTNYGILQGRSANYDDSDGDAIDTDGLLILDNYGLIQGLGAAGYHNGGLNTSEGLAIGGGEIYNAASGVIYSVQRAIQVDDSSEGAALGATQIVNDGRIESADGRAINIVGSFADVLTNRGTIIGSVLMGGGADTVNVVAGSSFSTAIDTGSGLDTIHLSGAGSADFAGAINAENLMVESGVWAVATGSFKQVVVSAGAGLTTALHATGSATIDVAAGAFLEADGAASVLLSGPLVGAEIANTGTIRGIASDAPISGSLAIHNTENGLIEAGAGSAAIALAGNLAGGTVLIENAGLISGSDAAPTSAIDLSGVTGGTILLLNSERVGARGDATVIRAGANMTIENTGVIESTNDVDANGDPFTGGSAIDVGSNGGVVIDNHGYLSGSRAVTGERGLTLFNGEREYILGNDGAALAIHNDATVAETVTVVNYGYMFGQSALRAGSDSDGDGIAVAGLIKLDNYGLIGGYFSTGSHDGVPNATQGLAIGGGTVNNAGTISSSGQAILVDDSHGGAAFAALVLTNTGSIIANELHRPNESHVAISIAGDFADTIVNSGTISGDVLTGGGDDVVTVLDAGVVTGLVSLGEGDDVFEGGQGASLADGGAGFDTVSYAHAAAGVIVNLSRATAQDTGGGGLDTLAGFEAVTGSAFGDRLRGTSDANTLDGGRGNDRLDGDDGDDRLTGGLGHDRLTGGAGHDLFVFETVADFGGTRHDVIVDLDRDQLDRIDLHAIDALTGSDGDQAFAFLGAAAFTGAGGEIRTTLSDGNTLVEGDLDGDRVADFQLLVLGREDLQATDFLL